MPGLAEGKGDKMDVMKFCNKIESSDVFDGVGMEINCGGEVANLIILSKASGSEVKLPINVVEQLDWDALSEIMLGTREPIALQHMSRVVGYFSVISNWNPSKVGELIDRHKGTYAFAG